MGDKEFPLETVDKMRETAEILGERKQMLMGYANDIQRWHDAKLQKSHGDPETEEGGNSHSSEDVRGKKRSRSPVAEGSYGKKSRHELTLEKEKEEILEKNVHLQSQLMKARAEIKDLSLRLSKEMEVKIARDETSLENICVKNRPMNVAEEYQLFCSDVWLDAKSALDDYMDNPALEDSAKESEQDMLTLLHDILMAAQTVLSSLHTEMVAAIRAPLEHVDQPMLLTDQKKKQVKQEAKPLPFRGSSFQQFDNAVGDILRARADNVSGKQFVQLVYAKLSEKHPDVEEDIVEHVEEVNVYTEKACSLVWKMVLQRPKMTFDTPGIGATWMGDSHQDVWWGSDNPEDPSSIAIGYVHPILYHGDKVMAKGKVILRKVQSKDGEEDARDERAGRKGDVAKVKGVYARKAALKPRKLKK